MRYAVLDANGVVVNIVEWDGVSDWAPPDGCTVVADPNCTRKIAAPAPAPAQTDAQLIAARAKGDPAYGALVRELAKMPGATAALIDAAKI